MSSGTGHFGACVERVSLVATGVSKAIDGNILLRPIDLRVGSGQCVVLRGGNGSGKTRLQRILAGTMDPSDGRAAVDERDLAIRR